MPTYARDALEMTAVWLLLVTGHSSTVRSPVTVVRKLGTLLNQLLPQLVLYTHYSSNSKSSQVYFTKR